MSENSVRAVIDQLLALDQPMVDALEELFSADLSVTDENPYWNIYEFEITEGPFASGDLRLSEQDDRAHLSLWPREGLDLTEDDLELTGWGQVVDIDVNPEIPPEGVDGLVYEVNGVQLAIQFTHNSRVLHSVALDWANV
jgi:hypothetical protein